MKVSILQHSDGTPPGTLLEWIDRRCFEHDLRRLHQNDPLPELSKTDLLVILGGPMNVDELDEHPWLVSEKAFIGRAIKSAVPCLGICLGGQLLAQALGGVVVKHIHWEVGWHPVVLENAQKLMVFQWHQDTFTLPPNARRIATNSITQNQAFAYADHVIGMQFHPEATPEWIQECAEETPYPVGTYVQTSQELRAGLHHQSAMRSWLFAQLDSLALKAVRRP